MATQRISTIHELSARVEKQLNHFASPNDDDDDDDSVAGDIAKGAAVAAVPAAGYAAWKNRAKLQPLADDAIAGGKGLLKTGLKKAGSAVGASGAEGGILRKIGGKLLVASNALERKGVIAELDARISRQLHEFGGVEVEEEPKKRSLAKGIAVGAGVSAAGLGARKLYKAAGEGKSVGDVYRESKEAGRTAVFRGMRGTAGVMNDAGNKVRKLPSGEKVGGLLKKGAKVLKKNSMKFFGADVANSLVRIEGLVREFEAL